HSASLLSWRGDRETLRLVPLDQARDQSRGFRLLDGIAQEPRARAVPAGRADGLLDSRELSVKDARTRQLPDIRQQSWSKSGQRVELFRDELIVGAVEAFRAHEFGILDVAGEPEIVGAACRDRDPHALAIDLLDRAQR